MYPSEELRKKMVEVDREFIQQCLYDFSDSKIRWIAKECLKIYRYKNKKRENERNN